MIHFVYLLFNQEINLNQKIHYENLILLVIGKHNLSLKGSDREERTVVQFVLTPYLL